MSERQVGLTKLTKEFTKRRGYPVSNKQKAAGVKLLAK